MPEDVTIIVPGGDMGKVSDGYHTFDDLYGHRAALFCVICTAFPHYAWKSRQHHDGTMFGYLGENFIVGMSLPTGLGQISYHYKTDPWWDRFPVQELDRAPEWDGHTPEDVIHRLVAFANFLDLSLHK